MSNMHRTCIAHASHMIANNTESAFSLKTWNFNSYIKHGSAHAPHTTLHNNPNAWLM